MDGSEGNKLALSDGVSPRGAYPEGIREFSRVEETTGQIAPGNFYGPVWTHTRGGIPALSASFPGRGFHASRGREGIPRLALATARCLSAQPPSSSAGDRERCLRRNHPPPSGDHERLIHRSLPPSTTPRRPSPAGPHRRPRCHQTRHHLIHRAHHSKGSKVRSGSARSTSLRLSLTCETNGSTRHLKICSPATSHFHIPHQS